MRHQQDIKRSYRDTIVCDAEFKVIVIGNPDAGKSSFIQRLTENKFNIKKSPTYGMDKKDMIVNKDELRIKFAIWDTAGQQNYRHITSNFINGCSAVFMAFDLTNLDSFLALEDWMKTVREKATSNCVIVILGNKCDLPNQQVQDSQVERFVQMNKIANYFKVKCIQKVSAKEGTGVKEAFDFLSGRVLLANPVKKNTTRDTMGGSVLNQRFMRDTTQKKKEGGCCS